MEQIFELAAMAPDDEDGLFAVAAKTCGGTSWASQGC